MTSLELWVNGFDADKVEWTRVGASPYLDALDDPTNIVHVKDSSRSIGDFAFIDPSVSGKINSVLLKVYAKDLRTAGNLRVYLFDGVDWHYLGVQTVGLSYAWASWDVSAILDTWAKITAAMAYLYSSTGTGALYAHVVDAFNEVDAGWTRVGTSPWLFDYTGYIWTKSKDTISEFSFPAFYHPNCTFNYCKLRLSCRQVSGGNDQIQSWIHDGSSWIDLGEITPNPATYTTQLIELYTNGVLDTVAKFDAAKLKLKHNATGSAGEVYVRYADLHTRLVGHQYADGMKLVVDYTPAAPRSLLDGLVTVVW